MSYERMTKKGGFTNDLDLTQEMGYSHIYNRLAELEDKLESGRLVELPCKVGDTVYWVDCFGYDYSIREETVKSISIETGGIKVYVSDGYFWGTRFGVCCFTDKAQAEARLKELQKGKK